ncbi:MAG: hypothetical protein ACYTBZ_18990 [Planctomycetota bacterium]
MTTTIVSHVISVTYSAVIIEWVPLVFTCNRKDAKDATLDSRRTRIRPIAATPPSRVKGQGDLGLFWNRRSTPINADKSLWFGFVSFSSKTAKPPMGFWVRFAAFGGPMLPSLGSFRARCGTALRES